MNFPVAVTAVPTEAPRFILKLKVSLACASHQISFARIGIILKYFKMVSFPSCKLFGCILKLIKREMFYFVKSSISTF